MDAKRWYASKTIWANLSVLVGAVGAWMSGGVDWQTAIWPAALALVNTFLRIITKQPVE